MFFSVSRAKWRVLPLLLGVLTLSSCGTKTDTPVASISPSVSASAPAPAPAASASAFASPSAMSSATTSAAPEPTGEMAMGMKPQAGECPKSEPIKGKISKRGKIYHVPNSQGYAEVKPTTCFASVTDAAKAGFRAPKHEAGGKS